MTERPKATTVDQLRQAERLVPGLHDRIEQSGYSEEQLAEMFDERVASGEIAPMRPGRTSASLYLRVAVVLVPLFGVLGYAGVLNVLAAHGARSKLPDGWVGAWIGIGIALLTTVVLAVADRVRTGRR